MDISHITSQSLRRLLELTDQKENLLKQIARIEDDIAHAVRGTVKTVTETTESFAESIKPRPAVRSARSKSVRGRRGGMKESILALLSSAGESGMRVKDIAEKLGAPAGNVSVWISTTGKKLVEKLSPGVYAVKSSEAPAPSVPTAPKVRKPRVAKKSARSAKPAKAPAKAKAAPAKKGFKLPKKP